MTIKDALDRIRERRPSEMTDEALIACLSAVDTMIYTEKLCRHEGFEDVVFDGYGPDTPEDTVLLAPPPYDDMYLHYLSAQIDYYNGEVSRYNLAVQQYNQCLVQYAATLTRTHMPLQPKQVHHFGGINPYAHRLPPELEG